MFTNIYVYTYAHVHVTTINEQRGYEFEREEKGVCGRVWREKKDREII